MNDKISTCKKKSKECLPTTGMATTEILVSIEVQLDPANSNLVISISLLFKLGHFKFPVILNSEPFSLDVPFSHSLSAILNSHYFKQFYTSPVSSK